MHVACDNALYTTFVPGAAKRAFFSGTRCIRQMFLEGLNIRSVDAGGEGNCLYHACSSILMGSTALLSLHCDMTDQNAYHASDRKLPRC